MTTQTDAEKYQAYLANQRKYAKKHYDTKMKPNDSMTESQKAEIAEKKRIVSEKNKAKYAANRDYYIQKSLENRRKRIERAIDNDISAAVTLLLSED
jgi:hypothetical protein